MSSATNNSPGHHSSASNCPSSGHSNPGLKCLPVYNTSSQHTLSPRNAATLYKQRLTVEENGHGEPNDVNKYVQGSAGGQQQHEEHNSETGTNSSEDDDENSSMMIQMMVMTPQIMKMILQTMKMTPQMMKMTPQMMKGIPQTMGRIQKMEMTVIRKVMPK